MKTLTHKKYRGILSILLALIILDACKKEKTPDPSTTPTATPTGTVMLHLHEYIGSTTEIDAYNIVYPDDAGRKISLSIGQLYITDIELQKADGTYYTMTGAKILKVLDTESYILGTAPVGNYKSIRFKVGLDATTNAAEPTTDALLNHPEMWFSATAQPDGYVFMNVQGKIDTTAAATGSTASMQPFSFKIGTNAHYKQVSMPEQDFSIVKDAAQFVHLYADFSKLFHGIDLVHQSLTVNTVADNSTALANAVTNNIPSMFSYEE